MFDRRQYQYILTVDSDSEPYPDACEHLLRAMSDPKVQAATGMIYIRNYAKTWVSMAADIDIGTSCVMMRASRSMLGALETTSGALALYRSELLYDHLDAYEVECGTGDDRWLALRALRRGEVVAVAEARVETDMPTTLSGTYKQRVRWARSWWWMLPYVFRHLSLPKLLSPLYGLVQLAITPAVFLYIVIETILSVGSRYSGHGQVLSIYLLAYAIVRYAASGLYLVARPRLSLREKLVCWIVGTPGAIVLNILWLTPIRYFALSKLLDNRWQTREVPNAEHQSNVPSVPCLTSYAPRSHENVTVSGDIRSMAGSSRATSYVPRHSKENVTARSAMNEVRSLTGGLSRPTSYGPRHSYENVMARSALGDVSSLPAASRRLPAPRQCLDGGVTQIIQQVHDHDRTVRLPVQPTDMDATIRFERVR